MTKGTSVQVARKLGTADNALGMAFLYLQGVWKRMENDQDHFPLCKRKSSGAEMGQMVG
jgi:hypothetical protein